MTKVKIVETEERVTILLKGHAEYDSTGRDIVCAACSVLAQSLINALQVLEIPSSWRQLEGEMGLSFRKEGEWKGAYTMAKVGYEMLAKSYPRNVTVQTDEGAG